MGGRRRSDVCSPRADAADRGADGPIKVKIANISSCPPTRLLKSRPILPHNVLIILIFIANVLKSHSDQEVTRISVILEVSGPLPIPDGLSINPPLAYLGLPSET